MSDVMWLSEPVQVRGVTYFPGWVNVRDYPRLRKHCTVRPPRPKKKPLLKPWRVVGLKGSWATEVAARRAMVAAKDSTLLLVKLERGETLRSWHFPR